MPSCPFQKGSDGGQGEEVLVREVGQKLAPGRGVCLTEETSAGVVLHIWHWRQAMRLKAKRTSSHLEHV